MQGDTEQVFVFVGKQPGGAPYLLSRRCKMPAKPSAAPPANPLYSRTLTAHLRILPESPVYLHDFLFHLSHGSLHLDRLLTGGDHLIRPHVKSGVLLVVPRHL